MSDLSLYKSCLQKVAIYLRDGIYKSCHENPFSAMPSSIVNELIPATLDLLPRGGLKKAYDLELLLTSGRLRELKIHYKDVYQEYASQLLSQVLRFLISGCQELEVLHLTAPTDETEPLSDVSEALENVLRKGPNLKDLVSRCSFDLKALRNCRKLRRVNLQFRPQQPWYEFLENENDHFLPHKYLEFFTIRLPYCRLERIPCDDVVTILRCCPELTSLGEIDTSEALSLLHKMSISPSELKLHYCFWRQIPIGKNSGAMRYINRGDLGCENPGAIKDAVQYYPVLEELDLHTYSIENVSYLRNLKNLVYLNITSFCIDNTDEAFRYALQEIGSQLKYLSFKIHCPVDISKLLQHSSNLESLRIFGGDDPIFASSVVQLPRLQRLCYSGDEEHVGSIFPKLSGCNQLTDLFILSLHGLDDETLYRFLKRNSVLNLKVAYLKYVKLTELGFREFLLKAPQLEKVEIEDNNLRSCHFDRVRREINHKAICNKNSISEKDEFFRMRASENISCKCDE